MARTRLRGLEIGGIQIGIEVPETFEWEWPESPVSEFQCLPREPEVHIGLRVDTPGNHDLGGERYSVGAWTFEVARHGRDWILGLSKGGRRAQLAHFDREFQTGEIIVSPEMAAKRAYPLRGPIDEWIVLHRTVARGGLCLTGSAMALDGKAIIQLGDPESGGGNRWGKTSTSLLGRSSLLLREEREQLRLFRTPWADSIDPRLPFESRVGELQRTKDSELAFSDLLDPADAADLLVTHAIVPLCDDALLDRVLRNAQRIAQGTRVVDLGRAATATDAPMAWQSTQMQSAFAPPRGGL